MNSSISNSDSTNSDGTNSDSTRSDGASSAGFSSKRAAIYTVVLSTIILASAVVLMNVFTYLAEKNAGDVFGVQRIRSIVQSLDYMAATDDPSVIMFGSSLAKEGFSPRHYDQALMQLGVSATSFNVGVGNMKPSYQLLLAKRMREAYEREGQKAGLSIIEFTPFLTTEARQVFRPFMTEQVTAVLMSSDEVNQIVTQDLEQYARMLSIKYLRNGVSAEAITGGIRYLIGVVQMQTANAATREVYSDEYQQRIDERKALQRQLKQHIAREHPLTGKSQVWNPTTQGGLIDMTDLSEEAQEVVRKLTMNLRDPKTLGKGLDSRIECCDILELNFNEQSINEFLAIVEEFKSFSREVVIVMLPSNPMITQPHPEALVRQEALIKRVTQQSGVPIMNYQQHAEFSGEQFFDATHLSMDSGRLEFSELLAQATAKYLRTSLEKTEISQRRRP